MAVADAFAGLSDRPLGDVRRRPVAAAARDVMHEAADDLVALGRVRHFRMELQAVEVPRRVRHPGDGRIGARRGADEAGGQRRHLVAVAHPHVERLAQAAQEARIRGQVDGRMAELAPVRAADGTAELRRHGLHSVADAEHRHAQVEDGVGNPRRPPFGHRFRPAGEDHASRRKDPYRFGAQVERMDLAVDALFPDAAGDELGVLRAEVDEQNALVDARVRHGISRAGNWAVPW